MPKVKNGLVWVAAGVDPRVTLGDIFLGEPAVFYG